MRELTAKQHDMLDFVTERIADRGASPTRAEIAKALGYNNQRAVDDVLHALEKKRRIVIHPRRHRNIEIICNY